MGFLDDELKQVPDATAPVDPATGYNMPIENGGLQNAESNIQLPPDPNAPRELKDIEGTRAWQAAEREKARQGFIENTIDSVGNTAAAAIWRKYSDEGALGLFGYREDGTKYDKAEYAKTLPAWVDRDQAANILDEPSLEAANRTLARITNEYERGVRMSKQAPGQGLAMLAGSLLDIDAPLAFLSGGAYGGAKIAAKTAGLAKAMGVSTNLSRRLVSISTAANAGLQGGLVVGLGEQATKETATWTDLGAMLLTSTALAGTLGGTFNTGKDLAIQAEVRMSREAVRDAIQRAEDEFLDRVASNDPTLTDDLDINSWSSAGDALPTETIADEAGGGGTIGRTTNDAQDTPIDPEASVDLGQILEGVEARLDIPELFDYLPPGEMLGVRAQAKARAASISLPGKSRAKLEDTLSGLGLRDLQYLESGKEKLVLGNDDYVVRIMDHDKAPTYPDDPDVLRPVAAGQVGLRWVEVMPRVKTLNGPLRAVPELDTLKDTLASRGVTFADPHMGNIGFMPDGRPVAIDGVKGEAGKEAVIPDLSEFSAQRRPQVFAIGGEQGGSIGAAQIGGVGGRPLRTLVDPDGRMSNRDVDIIDSRDQWRHDTDFNDRKRDDAAKWYTKILTNMFGSFSTRNITQLYTSDSAVLNWLGGVVYESPSGLNRGRATSSTRMENYHRRMQTHIGRHIDPLMNRWAKDNDATWASSGYSISAAGKRAFNRELMLEMNDRLHGRPTSSRHSAIQEAADRYDAASAEGVNIGKGRDGEISIDGAENWQARRGWTPYIWKGRAISDLMREGVTRQEIEQGIAEGYQAAGIYHKDVQAIAKAVVQRALARHDAMDSSVMSLMTADGREFLQESLKLTNMTEAEIEGVMKRLIGDAEQRSREGFAKHRNELDMNHPIRNTLGKDIRLVDLFEQDMDRSWQRYSRQISGAAALARVGITNRAKRQEVINAAQAEQRALGEEVMDGDLLHAMFSNFNAGPTHGFSNGKTNDGIAMEVAVAKRIANLGLLEKLGITQLGETGATIGQVGLANWWKRGPMQLIDKDIRAGNKELLADLAYVMGDIGYDHKMFAEWFDLDEVSMADRASWLEKASSWASNGAFVQSYTSLFNTVRTHQQQIAVLGMADKVFRTLRGGDYQDMLARFEKDLGLGVEELNDLESLIVNGVIEFAPEGHVNRLHMDQWDNQLAETFGAAMVRNMNQTVQKSMAGEQDAWMHTGWGSVMSHLMTFPMQAFSKQFMRNAQHMDKQALATMLFGMGTAMLAVNLRDAVDGKDRTQYERAKLAFSYNNMSGWFPTVFDPAMTILGLDDYRVNPYGHHASVIPPVFTQADNLRRVPGALYSAAFSEKLDYYDKQALKALPFAGTYVVSRIFD